jgi:hypothetical protein
VNKYHQELASLPEWVRSLVRAVSELRMHSFGMCDFYEVKGLPKRELVFSTAGADAWDAGFTRLLELAEAISAPDPAPTYEEAQRIIGGARPGVVEMVCDESAFDQPCAFGHRVEGHAVYCHNSAWPGSPRKCRRNRSDYRHEDCPGFVANRAPG